MLCAVATLVPMGVCSPGRFGARVCDHAGGISTAVAVSP